MNLSEEITLYNRIKVFADWAEMYIASSCKLIPKRQIEELDDYETEDIMSFKMMASFSLELYFKTYILIQIHQKNPTKSFVSEEEFRKFLGDNNLITHDLKILKEKVRDKSFDEAFIENAIEYFNCFEAVRYPTPPKKPKQIKGLFDYDDEMKKTFIATYYFLREKVKSYILKVNQQESEELEYSYEMSKL